MNQVFGYQSRMLRWLPPVGLVLGGAIAVVYLVGTPTAGRPPLLFAILWVGVLIWNGYWYLWCVGHSIEVDGTRVTWRAVLRSRHVDLADLTGNATIGRRDQLTVRGAPPLMMIPNQKGWVKFLAALNAAHSDHPFTPSSRNKRATEWLYFSSKTGYYERVAEARVTRPHIHDY